MDKYYKWKVLLLIAVVAFSIWKAFPLNEKINLGLDLQGGMQLLLQVELDKVPADVRKDATERVVEIVRNRIDELGVREPIISKQGNDQVVVQLPGVTDRKRAAEIVGKTAHLEFKLVSDDPNLLNKATEPAPAPTPAAADAKASANPGTAVADKAADKAAVSEPAPLPEPKAPEGYEFKEIQGQMGTDQILVAKEALLSGDHLTSASMGFDQYGQPIVQLQFDKEGAKIFDRVTFQNVGKRLAIVLDGKVHSAPVIRDRIPNGQAQITGNFSSQEASDLALVLRAGALPAPVKIIEERTVGASLGKDSVNKGVLAGIIGALVVFIFMPAYYLLAGFVADIGLFLYGLITIGFFAACNATLTLPGIAGFILSIGMAVDANVLIFERIREEYEAGKPGRAAISAGYHKAFSAIFDSNLTTLLTSVLLFMFGTGPVKGFAVTLSIGIIASMFSAIFVTRLIFDHLLERNPKLNLKMFQVFRKTNIHFLKGRFWAYGFSVITLGLGIMAIAMRGQENYGVEFTGGTSVHIEFQKAVEIGKLRSALEKEGVKGAMIQNYGEGALHQFVIKTAATDTVQIEKIATEIGGQDGHKILRVDALGPTVSKDLSKKAIWAVIWSALGILIYLTWRFEWKFAFAAVVALFHDSIFTFGVYALSGREINLPVIAAILTIMGFSVNDTIVTFDRVRDNLKLMRKTPFREIVEVSINQTLSRTILTTLTVLLTTLALYLFGGAAINDFAFTMLVGFMVGVYSTIFVATSLVVDMTGKNR